MDRLTGPVHIDTLSVTTFTPPDSCIGNSQVIAAAGIDASKVDPQPRYAYSQDGTAADVTGQVIGVVRGTTGAIQEVIAGSRVANVGDATVRIRIKKSGTNILSTAIVLTSSNAAYAVVDGTVSVSAVAHDNVLTADISAITGTGTLASGVFVQVLVYEDSV